MTRTKFFLAMLVAVPMLTACGGGGSSDTSSSTGGSTGTSGGGSYSGGQNSVYGTLKEGFLLNGEINGLTYETGDQTGAVQGGVLPYYTGAPVSVTLGGTSIGQSDGGLIVPFEGLEKGVTGLNADYWTNVAVLLMMADDDGDYSNGIDITSATRLTADAYSLDPNVDYATFVSTSSSALDDIATSTAAGSRTVPSAGTAGGYVTTIRNTLSSGLTFANADFLLFSESEGFDSAIELEPDNTGRLDLSTDGALGSNRAGDSNVTINSWGPVSLSDYPTAVQGFYLETDTLRLECYAINKRRNKIDTVCDSPSVKGRFVLADYLALYQGDTTTLNALNDSNLWLFDDMGTFFPSAAGNNVYVGAFTLVDGGGDFPNVGAGQWTNNGFTFDISSTTNDLDFGVTDQVGVSGLLVEQIEKDTGNTKRRLVTVAGTSVAASDLEGQTYTRYNMGSRANIGTITLEAGGTTSAVGVTWSVQDSGRQVILSGADYDRCSYSGDVVGDKFFVCDDSSGNSGAARAEYWRLSRP